MVVDYQYLNECTVKDSHPMPLIEEMIEQHGNNRVFSVMDLKSGFHQIPMKPEDRHKTVF